jgi:hypothetical protein
LLIFQKKIAIGNLLFDLFKMIEMYPVVASAKGGTTSQILPVSFDIIGEID